MISGCSSVCDSITVCGVIKRTAPVLTSWKRTPSLVRWFFLTNGKCRKSPGLAITRPSQAMKRCRPPKSRTVSVPGFCETMLSSTLSPLIWDRLTSANARSWTVKAGAGMIRLGVSSVWRPIASWAARAVSAWCCSLKSNFKTVILSFLPSVPKF